jgi:hypothetical protein
MATLDSLAAKLERMAARLDDELKAAKTEVGTAVITALVNTTPVDTSQALSNWQASFGAPNAPSRPPISPGLAGSTRASSASAAIAQAQGVFAITPARAPLFISNSLPYIVPLNEGSSSQAPAGFVARAVLVGNSVLRRRKWFRGR